MSAKSKTWRLSFPSLNGCLIRAAYPLLRLTQYQICYVQRRAPGFCKQLKYNIPIEIIRCSAPRVTAYVTGSPMNFGTCQEKCSCKGLTKLKPYFTFWVKVIMFPHLKFLLLHQTPALLTALLALLPPAGTMPSPVLRSCLSGCNVNRAIWWWWADHPQQFYREERSKDGFELSKGNLPTGKKLIDFWEISVWLKISSVSV